MTDHENTTPAGDQMPDAGDLQTWILRETWRTDQHLVYVRELHHSHVEPRMGDVHEVAMDVAEELRDARSRNELITLNTTDGLAVTVDPQHITAVEVSLIGPDGNRIWDVQPGRVDVDGGVFRTSPYDGKPLP